MNVRHAARNVGDAAAHGVIGTVKKGIGAVGPAVTRATGQGDVLRELEARRAEISHRQPDNPVADGFKVFSQCDEDGILESILQRLPAERTSSTCIEIGASDGLENNSHYLALKGYQTVWVEGSSAKVASIQGALPLPNKRLMVDELMVSETNAAEAAGRWAEFLGTSQPDLLSVDIDGPDYSVLRALLPVLDPLVIVVEYNSKFPPPLSLVAESARGGWNGNDYYGASLQAFVDLLDGHCLVGCNLSGVNAFFVRCDLADPFGSYSVADLYSPERHHLSHHTSGHRASLSWLAQQLRATATT